MKISEIARGTGLTKDTVRLYERLGLLIDISRPFPSNNYKDYGASNIERIQLIKQLQQVGFSLYDCKMVLLSTQDSEFDADLQAIMLQEKIEQIEMKIKELRKLKTKLSEFITED